MGLNVTETYSGALETDSSGIESDAFAHKTNRSSGFVGGTFVMTARGPSQLAT